MDWKWNARPKLISIQVAIPRTVQYAGEEITTGIFKTPVKKRIPLHPLNLEGDRQADLSVHGGRDKTVYAYPSEHYPYWKKELPGLDLPWGALGENFITAGLVEDTVFLGDRFTIGTAEEVGPGDKIFRIHEDENKVSISDAMRVYLHEPNSNDLARRALHVEYLSATWREKFRQTIYPHQQGASTSE